MRANEVRDHYVTTALWEETGGVAVGGRDGGVSGVRVNPVNSALEN